MALLMLGVFRPRATATAEVIGWLAVARAGRCAALAGRRRPAGQRLLFDGAFVVDGFARFMKVLTLVGSAGALLLSFDYMRETSSPSSSTRCWCCWRRSA